MPKDVEKDVLISLLCTKLVKQREKAARAPVTIQEGGWEGSISWVGATLHLEIRAKK